MKKRALVVLANGFEEAEAAIPVDVLRRCEVEVAIAGLKTLMVSGSHGISIQADTLIEEYGGLPDALVLPGGMPGAENLASSVKLKDLILKVHSAGKIVAAICASPVLVLGPSGVLAGKKATCYPGMEKGFPPDVRVSKDAVVVDGNIVTSRGPGTAFLFGLKISEILVGKQKADMVASQLLVSA